MKKTNCKNKRSLLIAMLIGDGTISNNFVYKLSHSEKQLEFLKWKIKLLDEYDIKNNGLKTYTSKSGYNTGKTVYYTQLSVDPIIKELRNTVYTPKKKITKALLQNLDALGLSIWYMDDGFVNINQSSQRKNIQHTIKISTCVDEETVNEIICYFKETWDINFRKYLEKNKYYSIASSSEEDFYKFVNIVKPYIKEVPSLLYKIRESGTVEDFKLEARDTTLGDDIVGSI